MPMLSLKLQPPWQSVCVRKPQCSQALKGKWRSPNAASLQSVPACQQSCPHNKNFLTPWTLKSSLCVQKLFLTSASCNSPNCHDLEWFKQGTTEILKDLQNGSKIPANRAFWEDHIWKTTWLFCAVANCSFLVSPYRAPVRKLITFWQLFVAQASALAPSSHSAHTKQVTQTLVSLSSQKGQSNACSLQLWAKQVQLELGWGDWIWHQTVLVFYNLLPGWFTPLSVNWRWWCLLLGPGVQILWAKHV